MSTLDLHNFNIENRSEWDGLIASVMAGVKSPARSSLIRNFGLGETNERWCSELRLVAKALEMRET
jgi:hypothetical protein